MDRIIPKERRQKERRRRLLRFGVGAVVLVLTVLFVLSQLKGSMRRAELLLGCVDLGLLEMTVAGQGRLTPAIEEIVVTPISSRILELYKRGGDSVDVGTPIMKLDLATMQTEYAKMLDQLDMRRYEIAQLQAQSNSRISDLEMRVKIGAMQIDRRGVELRNEAYLDSIGAGTQDKVREAQLGYQVAKLEQEQLQRQLSNSRSVASAELNIKQLELRIYQKSVADMQRMIRDARIESPLKGVLTFVNTQIGAQVAAGAQVAIVSDLSRFKVDAQISDVYSDAVIPGARATVRVGHTDLQGRVSSVTPLSQNGTIAFAVQLDEPDHSVLRSGLKVEVFLLTEIHEEVMRLPIGSYYSGKGSYQLFVLKEGGARLVRQEVILGESSYKYVEVLSGLEPGDQVAINDMRAYEHQRTIKIK